jgi:hypothetical protein
VEAIGLELEDGRCQEEKAELNVTGRVDDHCQIDEEQRQVLMGEDPHLWKGEDLARS